MKTQLNMSGSKFMYLFFEFKLGAHKFNWSVLILSSLLTNQKREALESAEIAVMCMCYVFLLTCDVGQ